jgi:hypothetical protein
LRRTRPLILLVLLSLLLAAPVAAQARTNVRVGIADQSAAMFDVPAYKGLKLKITRYFIRWDAAKSAKQLSYADAFVARANADHVKVLMHISTNDLRAKKAKLPTVAQYRTWVGKLVARYRKQGVTEWGAWNEANNKTQPTWRSPSRAAAFFKTMRGLCKGCSIVALDIQDQSGATRYIQRFYAALGSSRRYARIVGLHNYSDVNRPYRHGSGTKAIIRYVNRFHRGTQFWMTETGGVVNFGRAFKCNAKKPKAAEVRASKAVANMFQIARSQRRYIKRLYVYNWAGSNCRGFDTGLTRRNGTLRPAFSTLKKYLKTFAR